MGRWHEGPPVAGQVRRGGDGKPAAPDAYQITLPGSPL